MIFYNDNLFLILVIFAVVIISSTLHEFAHALVAFWNGDPTAKHSGRLTVNPVKHVHPVGLLMLMAVGFGYAKPVPVNPFNFKNQKRGIFTTAIAGVTVNIILSFFSAAFYLLFFKFWANSVGESFGTNMLWFFREFFLYMTIINVSLVLFNLLPLYPLDGFRVLEAFTRRNNRAVNFIRTYSNYILLGLIGMSIIIDLLGLKSVSPIFIYFDFLELYISRVGGFIWRGFINLWSLILGI